MATLNKVMLIGRLTDNPEEPRTVSSSQSRVIKFRFAVGRSKKNPATGQWENDPNPLYIDCEAWARPDAKRDLVNLISQYAKKGDSLFIEGRLQLDQWDDKQTGQKRSKHKVVVDSVEFIGAKGGGGDGDGPGGGRPAGGYGGRPAGNAKASAPPPDDGDEYGGGGGSGGGDGGDIPF